MRPFHDVEPVRRSDLTADLEALGVPRGGLLLAHVGLSSLGWVVGGAETVVRALLECVGERGTVAAVASWEDIPLRLEEWPGRWRQAYLDEMPGFDPEHSQANSRYGRFPERLRTWPGARGSAHPDQRVVAVGRLAEWLTSEHPLDDSFGPGTPFARLVEADGHVLMLGAPLRSVTLLHHAEALAQVDGKRRRTYRLPLEGGVWRTLSDIDVEYGPFPYEGTDPLEGIAAMAAAALEAGVGAKGRVAAAECHLFPAAQLVSFATAWLEERFGARSPGGPARA
jgi:aminoglycoside 3-N-acetyltransferase